MNSVRSYRDLRVWQIGIQVVLATYRLTRLFPRDELYGLVSQMRRAAVSIPSNIAEGHERKSSKEYMKHISIALGSRAELDTQLQIAADLGFCRPNETANLASQLLELGRMLQALYTAIQNRAS